MGVALIVPDCILPIRLQILLVIRKHFSAHMDRLLKYAGISPQTAAVGFGCLEAKEMYVSLCQLCVIPGKNTLPTTTRLMLHSVHEGFIRMYHNYVPSLDSGFSS